MTSLDLSAEARQTLWKATLEYLESYYTDTSRRRVAPELDQEKIRNFVRQQNFNAAQPLLEALQHVISGMEAYTVHTPHPAYYGLFNPRTNFASILGDLITATYNPQLAAWSHAPFALEVENWLIQAFGEKMGYEAAQIDGVFCSGGAEANLTAVLCALNHRFPEITTDGLQHISAKPVLYCSAEAHHSVMKAASNTGLGRQAVRSIGIGDDLRIDLSELAARIAQDKQAGCTPFLVIATAGTTGVGAIDDLEKIAALCQQEKVWMHVDAAWGGALALHPEYSQWIKGIEKSQSITFDAHKWLSIPMGASFFMTSQPTILHQTFRISTEYMPKDAHSLPITDPYTHSIQWSRRFIGLKLYFSMLVFGWQGYAAVIEHQVKMGDLLRHKLLSKGWLLHNNSPMPVVCFSDPRFADDPDRVQRICQEAIQTGKVWLSVYPVKGQLTFRACITNYNTSEQDIDVLLNTLEVLR
ncbi:MAG TPA: aminotransferase class V-fold PLP-dependent enzyme [Saprospiraceae bacterium]|nr:aminotransferase class V-fold PLP-dependent enzyme [Saprospiraceae bacterium]HMQ84971.1 aminotransferase class V-fold PLP-dependent enzyme [Saprospiraceae bacterium]